MVPGPLKKLAQDGHLGAIMAHLGRNLLPTWPILGANWLHLRPNFAQNLLQIVLETARSTTKYPKTAPGVAKMLQDSPWTLNVHGFGIGF